MPLGLGYFRGFSEREGTSSYLEFRVAKKWTERARKCVGADRSAFGSQLFRWGRGLVAL